MYGMCRCCQRCLEDIYWNCIEERFCYDESIANYNPDDDEDQIITTKNKNGIITNFQKIDNNNSPICTQPMRRTCSTISSKIHEEDYRREIQTNIPILAPEILSVFANSQIFVDHQPKLSRNVTKLNLPGIHGDTAEINDGKLLKKLEDISTSDTNNYTESTNDKKIKFTISSSDTDSPVELRRSISPQRFSAIVEEDSKNKQDLSDLSEIDDDDDYDEVQLRLHNKNINNENKIKGLSAATIEKKPLRSVQSVPYFSFRQASENDIFSISGSLSKISMTPEVPSISYTHLPKNYIDTPTNDKYKESVSLYSIQAANKAKALQEDYSMPRYFRMPTIMAQSTGNISSSSIIGSNSGIKDSKSSLTDSIKKVEKGKRLKLLRGSLPPLLIHTVRSHKKDDIKQMS